jgi:hypothetical protein
VVQYSIQYRLQYPTMYARALVHYTYAKYALHSQKSPSEKIIRVQFFFSRPSFSAVYSIQPRGARRLYVCEMCIL